MGIPKNKSRIRGKFSKPKKRPSTHHDSPRFHHKLTIKKPHPTTRFSQNPPQKPQNHLNKKIPSAPSAKTQRSSLQIDSLIEELLSRLHQAPTESANSGTRSYG